MADMRTFTVEIPVAQDFSGFVAAFNTGFCQLVGGNWHGNSWDAFHDYLSWPEGETFRLVFRNWQSGRCLSAAQRAVFDEILEDNPHVEALFE